ncbi:MAG: hypothetical protein M1819_002990 [Sarea resinae]|nr:MAG: hypothetical protein M1819_002990 [Sarea resinae]
MDMSDAKVEPDLEDRGDVEPVGEKGTASLSSPPSPISAREQAIDVFCIGLNTVCTVALVFLNKKIFRDPQLKQMQISFAMWHFACTAAVLWIASHRPFNLFTPVRLPFFQMIPLCSFFAGFLILNNLSLTFNTVGFYQLAKIMTTPCVVFLNYVLFGKTINLMTALTLLCVCFGVSLTNTQVAGSNPAGATIAALAFTVTAVYQIWIGKKIKDFQVSSPQLLMNQAPISVLLLAFLIPFFDTPADFRTVPEDSLVALFFSGIVASLLNLSQFLIIGRTSAVTFNVASNLKTVIIVTAGWISDGKVLNLQDLFGITFAVGGAMAYSQLSQR